MIVRIGRRRLLHRMKLRLTARPITTPMSRSVSTMATTVMMNGTNW